MTLTTTYPGGTTQDTLTLTVANVAPSLTINPPLAGATFQPGKPVSVVATIADPGRNDTQTCTIDWGDGSAATGTLSPGVPGAWTCTALHTYSGDGTFNSRNRTISVNVTDDDTASRSATVGIAIDPCTWRGTGGNDNHNGTSNDDVLCGLGGNDTLNGLGGDDTLVGAAGNDILIGGPAADRLLGGDGIDRAQYLGAPGPVTVSLASGTASGAWGNDTLSDIEDLYGGAFADTLVGDGAVNEQIEMGMTAPTTSTGTAEPTPSTGATATTPLSATAEPTTSKARPAATC